MLSAHKIIDNLIQGLNENPTSGFEGEMQALYAEYLQALADPFAEKTEDLLSVLKRGLLSAETGSSPACAKVVGSLGSLIELCTLMRNQKVPAAAVKILAKSSVAQAIAAAILASGTLSPTELAKRLQKSSQNLVELERQMVSAGLLRRDEFGRNVRYSATPLLRACNKILATAPAENSTLSLTEPVAPSMDLSATARLPISSEPRRKVLVVEDEPKVALNLVKVLEADGFVVDLAADGESGLANATEVDYDCIVLDWNLPKLDGLTVLKKLRKAGSIVRILLLSGRKDVEDRVRGLQAGADDYLVKPFSFEEFLARFHALLRRPQELLEKVSVGDLELDRLRHTVTRAGKQINLTQREYAVLEYLMSNAGNTVTRTMVVENVWNLGLEGLTNIVDVYINHLRQKIDQGFKKPLIHEKGIGFVLGEAG